MKTLYLLRHAEAENTPNDLERDLTERGRRQAESLGQWMSDNGIRPARIFSSSARRAHLTAKICSEEIGYQGHIRIEEALYGTYLDNYVTVIKGLNNKYDSVMIVGHNPELSDAITFFTGDQIKMLPCTLVCIEFTVEKWGSVEESNGILRWVQIPTN